MSWMDVGVMDIRYLEFVSCIWPSYSFILQSSHALYEQTDIDTYVGRVFLNCSFFDNKIDQNSYSSHI